MDETQGPKNTQLMHSLYGTFAQRITGISLLILKGDFGLFALPTTLITTAFYKSKELLLRDHP